MIVDVTPFLTKRGGVFILSDITTPGIVHRMDRYLDVKVVKGQ